MKRVLAGIFLVANAAGAGDERTAVLYTLAGAAESDELGSAVAALDDIDGDGAPDFAVGARQRLLVNAARGYVDLISGRTGQVIREWKGWFNGQQLGNSLCSITDLDGDGKRDLVAADISGEALIYSPASGDLLRTYDFHTKDGGSTNRVIIPVRDVNGDGIEEILVGQSTFGRNGRAAVYSGMDGRTLWDRRGDFEDAMLGFSVCSLGDVDGDGIADVAVGQPHGWHDPLEMFAGTVYILGGLDGRVIHHFGYDANFPFFGVSVANVGDLDGDGAPELAVGSTGYGWRRSRKNLGWVGIHSPRTLEVLRSFEGIDRWQFGLGFDGDQLGMSVGSAGDADGDGVPDFLISSIRRAMAGFGRTSQGRVDLRSGRTGALLESFEERIEDEIFGFILTGIGDVDGDGRGEFAIGSIEFPHPTYRGQVVIAKFRPELPRFLRGDANGDGRVDISDVLRMAEIFFLDEDPGPCLLALDVDGDGKNLTYDLGALILYLFRGDLAPAPPFPECGRYGGVQAPQLECRESFCPE